MTLPGSTQCDLCYVLVHHFLRLYHISDSNLISRPVWGMGEVQRSQQTEVRTQEREAECNRGRTTCRPAWDALIGSSRSGGPGSPPAGPACGFCGVVEMKCYQTWKNYECQNSQELLIGGWKPLFSAVSVWSGLRLIQIYWSEGATFDVARHSHQHCPQLEEVIVLWVLHLHDSPGVQTAPHLLPLGLDLLVGSHHCKWDTGLKKNT